MKAKELRKLLQDVLPEAAHAESDLESGHMYLPAGHIKAIALNRPVVVGDRGSGKSFWFRSLAETPRRELIGAAFKRPELLSCEVKAGFSPSTDGDYPSARDLSALLEGGIEARLIWYAVMVQAATPAAIPPNIKRWGERVAWLKNNSEAATEQLRLVNSELVKKDTTLLIVFDGLDRTSSSWDETILLLSGLLQAQLEFNRFSHIKTKSFIRPDMLSSPGVRRFPDASKLLSLAVRLEWDAIDLYGLLWQYLANSHDTVGSQYFRTFSSAECQLQWESEESRLFVLAQDDRYNASKQESLFHKIAGENIRRGKKGGNTWTWLPKHLADARGYTSPRSFLVALKYAAIDSDRRKFAGETYALHTTSLQNGVAEASKTRRIELEENFPWIADVLGPLKGIGLPARRQDLVTKWKKEQTLDRLRKARTPVPLPKSIAEDDDPVSIISALEELGLCRMLSDGRIDVPDIVRMDAGMTRKGGIPVR